MMNTKFLMPYIIILIGFLVFLTIYIYNQKTIKKEEFKPKPDDEQIQIENFQVENKGIDTLPYNDFIRFYINCFNMPSSNPQMSISSTIYLDGFTVQRFTTEIQNIFKDVISKIFVINKDSVLLEKTENMDNKLTITIKLWFDSISKARKETINFKDTITSNDTLTKIKAAGMTSVTYVGIVKEPEQGIQLSITMNNTYQCATNYWCDYNNPSYRFYMKGDAPLSIKSDKGLNIKDISLIGPSSENFILTPNCQDKFNRRTTELSSFTAMWFMNFSSIKFDKNPTIIWFRAYAETPAKIKLELIDNSTTIVTVKVTIGTKEVSWDISKSTLMANSVNTLYTLMYNKDTNNVSFVIGKNHYTKTIERNSEKIILGISPVEFNTGSESLDANLLAFLVYNRIINTIDIDNISEYFTNQANGMFALELARQRALSDANALKDQLSKLEKDKLDNLEKLKKQLEQCQLNSTPKPVDPKCPSNSSSTSGKTDQITFPTAWRIGYNGGTALSSDDLEKCVVFKVTNPTKPSTSPSTITLKSSTTSTKPKYTTPKLGPSTILSPTLTPSSKNYDQLIADAYSTPNIALHNEGNQSLGLYKEGAHQALGFWGFFKSLFGN